MNLKILGLDNKEAGTAKLPAQFSEEIRPDLIKRATLAINNSTRQMYGSDPRAGKKQSAKLSRRRRDYKGAYGKGLSRMPRKTMTRRGMQMNFVGAFAPGTVGGRRAFPPVPRDFSQKINDKERRKAIRSALAATMNKEIVSARGHNIPSTYPFAVASEFEKLTKTKDVKKAFETLGLGADLERSSSRKIRAGIGKNRARPYKESKGPLVIVSDTCDAIKATQGIRGVDVVKVKNVNAALLAPGAHAGRLTIFTKAALEKLDKEKLFM